MEKKRNIHFLTENCLLYYDNLHLLLLYREAVGLQNATAQLIEWVETVTFLKCCHPGGNKSQVNKEKNNILILQCHTKRQWAFGERHSAFSYLKIFMTLSYFHKRHTIIQWHCTVGVGKVSSV